MSAVNPTRVRDILESEMIVAIEDALAEALSGGSFENDGTEPTRRGNNGRASREERERKQELKETVDEVDYDILDCGLADELLEYQETLAAANTAADTLAFLDSDFVNDDDDYFTCGNAVFATSEWCVE